MITYTDTTLMPYGQYRGQKLANVPATYLMWLYSAGKATPPMRQYIEANKDVLQKEMKRSRHDSHR